MKLIKHILSFAAAAGLIAACQTPEIVQVAAPENVVPAALHELEVDEIAITATNQQETVEFSWEEADYGAKTALRYSVEAALTEDGKKATIVSGIDGTTATVTYEELNRVLFNDLEVPEGEPTELKIYVGSVIYSGAVTASFQKIYSQPVSLTVTVTAAEKVYPMIYVIGSFNGWADGTTQELFEFTPDTKVYSGMIGFAGKAAEGWKVRGSAEGWKNELGNWGLNSADPAPAAEPKEINMYNDGGSSDIKVYSKNFYHMTFDTNALKLKMNLSFDNIGVVGAFNGWSEVNNVEMQFNTVKQRFYADVEFAEDGEFKFNIDKAWTTSFGVGANGFLTSENGGNIAVKAGNYRVYLNMNNLDEITYELNKSMYGQEEGMTGGGDTPDTPDTPTPPVMSGWGIVGSITNWGNLTADNTYIPDVALTNDGTWYAAKAVEIPAGAEIKFRKDGQWASQWGLGADAFAANTEMTLSSDGGSGNITPAAGTYDIYLNPETGKVWFITDGSYPGGAAAPEASEWGVVGVVTGWADHADITMYKTATEGLFVAYKVDMPDGGFKIRANGVWNDAANYGLASAGPVEVDHAYDLVCSGGSGDMILAAGTYDIWFDLTNSKVYIMTPGKPISEAVGGGTVTPPAPAEDVWGVVGTITNWADNADINMTEEGDWLVAKAIALTTTDEFKFRTNGTWGTERTSESTDPVAVNTEYKAVAGSSNIKVAVDGTFDLYLAKSLDKFYVMEQGLTPGQTSEPEEPEFEAKASEWGIVGDVNGWNAPDITMYTTPTEGLFVARDVNMPAGGFKIRANNIWDDTKNYGLESAGNVEVDHVYNVITSGGSGNMTVVAGTYDIWFDLTNTKVYIMTPGKDISEAKSGTAVAPLTDTWYLVGDFNGWKPADATYKMTAEGEWYVFKNFTANGKGVKFVADANWNVNRGGTFKANAAISLSQGGADMMVTAGTYDVYLSADAKKGYFMTPGTKPAN